MGRALRAVLVPLLLALPVVFGGSPAGADGTETLGEPSIAIADADAAVMAAVGTHDQPAVLETTVPDGATVRQVLLYWNGTQRPADGDVPDTEITVNGVPVSGAVIGGPTHFFGSGDKQTDSVAVRADITSLGFVSDGTSHLEIDDMAFGDSNNGASVVVLFDDGSDGQVFVRDGLDVAYEAFPGVRGETVPQTVAFGPSDVDRMVFIDVSAGSTATDRPHAIDVTIGGETTSYSDPIVDNGPEMGHARLPVMVPAGVGEVTVELVSRSDGSGRQPASFEWVNLVVSIPPDGRLIPTKEADETLVQAGEGNGTTYRVTVTNTGATAITDDVVDDYDEVHTSIVDGSISDGGVDDGSTITWTDVTVPGNSSIELSYDAEFSATQGDAPACPEIGDAYLVVNTVTVADEQATEEVCVGQPNITVDKEIVLVNGQAPVGEPPVVEVGDQITYEIVATNTGQGDGQIDAVDDYDQDAVTDPFNISAPGVDDGDVITWSGVTVPAGGSVTLSYDVVVDAVPSTTAGTNDCAPDTNPLINTVTIDGDMDTETGCVPPPGCDSGDIVSAATAEATPVYVNIPALGIDSAIDATAASAQNDPASSNVDEADHVTIDIHPPGGPHIVTLELIKSRSEAKASDAGASGDGFVQIVDLNLLDGTVRADALTSVSSATTTTSSTDASTFGSRIEGLSIPGLGALQDITFGTELVVPGIATVTLYDRIHETDPSFAAEAGMTLLRIDLDDELLSLGGGEIVIGQTAATAATTNDPCTGDVIPDVSAEAAALDLSGPVPVTLARSGPIPSAGGEDLSALYTASVNGVATASGLFTSAAGGVENDVSYGRSVARTEGLSALGTIIADVAEARTRTTWSGGGASTTASTTIADLRIGGLDVCTTLGLEDTICTPAPNTPFLLPANPLLSITLNHQDDGSAGSTGEGVGCAADAEQCTVEAIRISILTPVIKCTRVPFVGRVCLPTGELTTDVLAVSRAHSDAHEPTVTNPERS